MSRVFILLLFLIISSQTFAERLGKTTQLYEKPGRRTIAQLSVGTPISIIEEKRGWLKVIATAYTATEGFDANTLELKRGALLRDENGNNLGRIYGKLKLQGLYSITDDTVSFEIIGYIRKSQLDTNWIPERRFITIIDSAKSKVTFNNVSAELERFGFLKAKADSGFIAYKLFDTRGLDIDNPLERLKLVFYEQRLVAIFHNQPFPLKTKEVIQIGGQKNLIYLRDLSAEEKKVFGNLFLID